MGVESRGSRVEETARGLALPIDAGPSRGGARFRGSCRRSASTYLGLFLLAVAAAPHGLLNDLEDHFLDRRSDSGIILQAAGRASPSEEPAFQPLRLVPDVPCPACFKSDFLCAPTVLFLFCAGLGAQPFFPYLREVGMQVVMFVEAASRAPPRFA